MTCSLAGLLCLAIASCAPHAPAAGPDFDRYLKPGTAAVGGVSDLCLIYHGGAKRPVWNTANLLPYVAYVDGRGRPRDWLFDSFLLIEFQTDRGSAFDTPSDWQWLLDAWFRPDTGLAGLEGAVEQAGKALGQPDHKVKVVITMPVPSVQTRDFGALPGTDAKLDFSRDADHEAALRWYIDACLTRWRARNYRHLELVGMYWVGESIPAADRALVQAVAGELHERGLKLFWIPFAGAEGVIGWQELGIDATLMQPNEFFAPEHDAKWFVWAANGARKQRAGLEIEFDERALTSEDYHTRFRAYLDAGAKYGWMDRALLGYYEGGGALLKCARTPGAGRAIYRDVYHFVKGTYAASGETELPELLNVDKF
jgi:hypothetical protein